MTAIKRIPYGKGDFEAVNAENRYYIDKTLFIPKIESTDFVFLIRPRRFGKTLFLSMLQTYYDINKKDRFAEFFRDTWILKNPTEEQGKYMILYFNFSEITKDKDVVQDDFNNYCVQKLDRFIYNYQQYIPQRVVDKIETVTTAHEKLHILSTELESNQTKIYLLIDEYDNFTNSLLADYDVSNYKKIAKEGSYFKQFFSNLKAMASGSGAGLARMFITGVSPVTMDDVTSGFNIGDNISMRLEYATILGFTEKDVEDIIDYYTSVNAFRINKNDSIQIFKKWYNNYLFSEDASDKVYNTDMILYFFKEVYNGQSLPKNLIDHNLRMDYRKLQHLVLTNQKINGNFDRLNEIINNNGISSTINTSFPHDEIIKPENFISLLYFLGMLTFSGAYSEGTPFLTIPNETIRKLIFEYIRSSFETVCSFSVDLYQLREHFKKLAYRGDFKSVCEFLADTIKTHTSIRDYLEGEKVVQGFFLAYFNVFDFYVSLSEEEMNKGYADIVLKPFYLKYPDIKYAYLLEFKYISRTKDESELSQKIQAKIVEATTQLAQYQHDDNEQKLMHTSPYGNAILKKGIIIFHGWELAYLEEV